MAATSKHFLKGYMYNSKHENGRIKTLREIEKEHLIQTLAELGDRYKTSQALNITLKTLITKLGEYNEFEKYKVR